MLAPDESSMPSVRAQLLTWLGRRTGAVLRYGAGAQTGLHRARQEGRCQKVSFKAARQKSEEIFGEEVGQESRKECGAEENCEEGFKEDGL